MCVHSKHAHAHGEPDAAAAAAGSPSGGATGRRVLVLGKASAEAADGSKMVKIFLGRTLNEASLRSIVLQICGEAGGFEPASIFAAGGTTNECKAALVRLHEQAHAVAFGLTVGEKGMKVHTGMVPQAVYVALTPEGAGVGMRMLHFLQKRFHGIVPSCSHMRRRSRDSTATRCGSSILSALRLSRCSLRRTDV